MTGKRATIADYYRLIDKYIETAGPGRAAIGQEIEDTFSTEATILVLDISGFSRLTAKHGIIFYLAMVRRMQKLSSQMIGDHEGQIIKFEADNLFAMFDDVDHALHFAWALRAGFDGMNVVTDDDSDIHISVGIASGTVLLIDGKDVWGKPMNLASKLGEDIAAPDEILVCAESFASVADATRYEVEHYTYDISGISIPAVSVGTLNA